MHSKTETSIKTVIVDDEIHARNVIQKLIFSYDGNFEIIGSFEDLSSAVLFLKKYKTDVVFLDIQMPGLPGYKIVDFFENPPFEMIFVTAYSDFAIKAFELSAVDYLLKPVQRDRFYQTLEKLEKEQQKKLAYDKLKILQHNFDSDKKLLVIPEMDGNKVIRLEKILAFEGQGSYSKIYLRNGNSFLISKNLKTIESMLPENDSFFRCQKSWLINLFHLEEYSLNQNRLILKGALEVKISRHKIAEFNTLIQQMGDR